MLAAIRSLVFLLWMCVTVVPIAVAAMLLSIVTRGNPGWARWTDGARVIRVWDDPDVVDRRDGYAEVAALLDA